MVTKTRLFSPFRSTYTCRKPLIYKESQKLARHLLYLWHNNNNKQSPTQ